MTHHVSNATQRPSFGWMRRLSAVVVVVAAVLVAAPEDLGAQSFVDGTRATGMGTAFTGVGTGAEGLYHNPGGIATARMYAVDATFEVTPANSMLNASIIDSTTNPNISMGAGYSYLLERGSDVTGHDIRLAASVPAVEDTVAVGIGGRYMILNQDDVEYARGFTLDAGIIAQPAGDLRLGLAGKNLIDVCRKPEVCGGVTPRLVELGTAYGDPTQFTVSADVGSNFSQGDGPFTMRVDAGGEYLIGGMVPLRGGYRWRQLTNTHTATFGTGWRSESFGLDAGVAIPPEAPDDFQLSVGFELYVN